MSETASTRLHRLLRPSRQMRITEVTLLDYAGVVSDGPIGI